MSQNLAVWRPLQWSTFKTPIRTENMKEWQQSRNEPRWGLWGGGRYTHRQKRVAAPKLQLIVASWKFCICVTVLLNFLFLEREDERARNIHQLPVAHPQLGTLPATQARAMTGNWTSDFSVCRLALNPLSYTSQGSKNFKIDAEHFMWLSQFYKWHLGHFLF